MKKILQKIFSIKNDEYHKILTILGIKIKYLNRFKYYEKHRKECDMFLKRYIKTNANIQYSGLHGLKKRKFNIFATEFKALYSLKEKIEYFILGSINIPQIEFTITTKCTLKCQSCVNYIPQLDKNEQSKISFEEFKMYLDNLLKSVHNIYNLLLIGGEPLLCNDLYKYLDYAASKKQVKNVWIVTNGTMLMNEELIKVCRKYNKKVSLWLSNYSANKELELILKHEKLFEQFESTGCYYVHNKDLTWSYVTPDIVNYCRDKQSNIAYFEKCLHPCTAVFNDKIFICPRAGTFYLKGLYEFAPDETVSLKECNKKLLKKQLVKFYSRNYFTGCNFCNGVDDRKQPRILPAIQIKNQIKEEVCV